jgi:MerR family mercuric resistance operon transcriptional regulator
MKRGRTIGKLAEEAGVHVETIRYYERRGILTQPPKPENGWRTYGDDSLATLRFVKRAQWMGFSLDEIEELLALRAGSANGSSTERAKEHISAKLEEVQTKLEDLSNVRNTLQRLVKEYEGPALFEAFHAQAGHAESSSN